jgi:hypothetical protein
MNVDEQKLLAEKMRDQSLVDLLIAQVNRGQKGFRLGAVQANRNHLVISKCQQSAEKLLKAYFVWHGDSLNPFRGHTPMQDVLGGKGGLTPRLQKFRRTVRQSPHGLLTQITWLENLAPSGAPNGVASLAALNATDLTENTEYPFYSKNRAQIVSPAEHFGDQQGIGAMRAAYFLCDFIAESDETAFGVAVEQFVRDHPRNSTP